jgi:hypothetical protein
MSWFMNATTSKELRIREVLGVVDSLNWDAQFLYSQNPAQLLEAVKDALVTSL